MDTGEEVRFKEVDLMAEEETVLCREGDMMADRDMIVLLLSEILLLSEDQILEEGQTLEGEKDFAGIDLELQIGLQISQNVSGVGVKLVRK